MTQPHFSAELNFFENLAQAWHKNLGVTNSLDLQNKKPKKN